MIHYQPFNKIALPSLLSLTKALFVTSALLICLLPAATEGGFLQSVTECIQRDRYMFVNKTTELRGRMLTCEGPVKIKTCWGRCKSFEFGDYKIPYRVSHHPVCTYGGMKPVTVTPPDCHEDHPDPTTILFEATSCQCAVCDSKTTSCENLKG